VWGNVPKGQKGRASSKMEGKLPSLTEVLIRHDCNLREVSKCCSPFRKHKKFRKTHWMRCLEKFTLDTSIFTYFLTSIGYMLVIMDKLYFWLIYIIMCLTLVVAVYYDIVKPLMRENDSVSGDQL